MVAMQVAGNHVANARWIDIRGDQGVARTHRSDLVAVAALTCRYRTSLKQDRIGWRSYKERVQGLQEPRLCVDLLTDEGLPGCSRDGPEDGARVAAEHPDLHQVNTDAA